jgi:hypothetical protein
MEERRLDGEEYSPRFLLDGMLGTLARNLRMLGFDAVYATGRHPEPMIRRAAGEGRWFLTRRTLREKEPLPIPVLKITDDAPHRQLLQVLRALPSPSEPSRWFTRCLRCNRLLDDLSQEEAQGLVPEYIAHLHRQFRRCPSCARIFWPGSHSLRMRGMMEAWVKEARGGEGRMDAGEEVREGSRDGR